jgi:5-methylcytosine-specific restriction protein A
MAGCVLSLNQGYTQFKTAFGTDALAAAKILESAAVALTYLNMPDNFIAGPIDLAATGNLGVGYERGAIASVAYHAHEQVTPEKFLADFSLLLDAYDVLRQRIGPNIVDAASPATEDDFQEAATALSKPSKSYIYTPPPPGPVTPPPKSTRSGGSGYKRDPRVAGAAISGSGYLCEIDAGHVSFPARATKKNFVEAHHLIPLQFQDQFGASLDVLENIIALCPTCHRKLHHAQLDEKAKIVRSLLVVRTKQLKGRGLTIGPEQLLSLYRAKLED